MSDLLEQFEQIKRTERRQLESGEPPSVPQFWTQPFGVRLLLIGGDALGRVPEVVRESGMTVREQRTGRMTAYPAHVGTLLSRRRRGNWTVATAAWLSSGWTIVQGTRGETVSTDSQQIALIAKRSDALVVGVHYDHFNGNVGLIEAAAGGAVTRETYLTPVLTRPNDTSWHPEVVAEPTPAGLAKAIQRIGFDVAAHLLAKVEMLTILTAYTA